MIKVFKDPAIKLRDQIIDTEALPEYTVSQKDLIGWVPHVHFKLIPIETAQITYFKLDSSGFLPELELVFSDYMQYFRADLFALDNEIISIYINSRLGSLRDIKMDFKVIEYNYDRFSDVIYLKGTPNIDGLYMEESIAYRQKTSFEALNELTTKLELGIASNIESTNDSMTWLNPGDTNISFIQHVTKWAYKNIQSFFWSFIDFYYNLNFINVEIEMLADASKNVGIVDTGAPIQKIKDENKAPIILYYTREINANSNMMFNKYEIYNQSTTLSLDNGYRKSITFWNTYGNWEKRAGEYNRITIETSQAPGIAEENIVLKSTPADATKFYKHHIKGHYAGKIDPANVHSNFRIAHFQNNFNLDELQKIYIIVNLQTPNFNLQKFMKIKIEIMDIATPHTERFRNNRISGAWLITGIIFELEDGFVQKLVLCRRELTSKNFNI